MYGQWMPSAWQEQLPTSTLKIGDASMRVMLPQEEALGIPQRPERAAGQG